MSAAELAAYVSPGVTLSTEVQGFVDSCWAEAEALVSRHVATVGGEFGEDTSVEVPAAILNRAKIEVGAELYYRRSAPNGIKQFATPEGGGTAVRVARDPMLAAYPILAPYVGLGLA